MNDIVIRGLNKSFAGKQVLKDYCRTFRAGEQNLLEGPSGFGKTTILNLLMGLETPDSGVIEGVPEKISCVFQEDRLCEDFSAIANARIPGASEKEAAGMLASLGLGEDLRTKCRDLSGGMKRRVALARALLADFDLLLLDEPFTGLDADSRRLAEEAIARRAAGKTVILVHHAG